jgi:hypothetical protein
MQPADRIRELHAANYYAYGYRRMWKALTPRSSSSSGYFLGLDMTAEDLLSPGQRPGSEVPAKPGPAHLPKEVGKGSRASSHCCGCGVEFCFLSWPLPLRLSASRRRARVAPARRLRAPRPQAPRLREPRRRVRLRRRRPRATRGSLRPTFPPAVSEPERR